MPEMSEYDSEEKWMSACVPKMVDEGKPQEQAVAICMDMWRGGEKSLRDIPLIIEAATGDTLVTFGGAVKALGGNKFGGYLVRFSDADNPDLTADYFTKGTDFDIEFPAQSTVYFNHGMDRQLKQRKLGKAELHVDEVGVWAETILQERDEYEKKLIQLAKAGKLGWSSGTAAHLVERQPEGKAQRITRWPLGLDASLTHTPAEPRNMVVPLKSISVVDIEPEESELQAESAAKPATEGKSNQGVKKMELEDSKLQEMLSAAANQAAEAAVKTFIAAQPSAHKPDVQVTEDEADRALAGNPFKTAGEFFSAVKNSSFYPAQTDKRLLPLKATGLNETIPSQGGFLVPQETASGILDAMYDTGSLLSYMNRIPVQGNGMTFNAVDETSRAAGSRWGGVRGYWMAEAGTKTASKPTFRALELKLKKVAALVVATDELLEDAGALAAWINKTVPMELRYCVEDAIINGNQPGQPLGMLASPALKSAVRTDASEIDAYDIGRMWAARAPEYKDYVWGVNPRVFGELLNLTVGTTPVFLPAGGLSGMPYATLLGRPVVELEYLPTLGTAGDILLFSPSAYPMIEKAGGVQAASSIHVYFTTDEQAFRFVYRVDGAPSWYTTRTEKDTSTTSPFVVLAATT